MKSAIALAAWSMACSASNEPPPAQGTGGGSSGSAGLGGIGPVGGNGGVGAGGAAATGGGFGAVGNTGNTGSGATTGKMGCGSNLTATIRDLKQDHPDVELKCKNPAKQNNYHDTDIVALDLGTDNTPVYAGPAGGTPTTTGPDSFFSWFHDVPDVNQSLSYTIQFTMDAATGLTVFDSALSTAQGFYPVDGQLWGNPTQCQGGMASTVQLPHNYYFTTELHTVFVARAGDVFSFSGDDDVWVFINRKLVVNLGGVHEVLTQDVAVDQLGLTPGQEYPLDFFHAERQALKSNFKIQTNLFFTVCGTIE